METLNIILTLTSIALIIALISLTIELIKERRHISDQDDIIKSLTYIINVYDIELARGLGDTLKINEKK